MSDDVLVKVEGVSKKFCRSLKRSLWYGVQDVSAEMLGRRGQHSELRKNEFWAVNDVSFELKRGECLGLIGPNGAGKSTLLKMLNGLVKPDKGRITMRGRVGALIELGAGFNPILTVRENIFINGSVLGYTKVEIRSRFDSIVEFAQMEDFVDAPVQSLSSGMKVRLGFAIASNVNPDVLLIDEVLAVGDAGYVARCFGRMAELLETTAIILVSHSMPNISRLSTGVLCLAGGKTSYSGSDLERGFRAYFDNFPADPRRDVFSKPGCGIKDVFVTKEEESDTGHDETTTNLSVHVSCIIARQYGNFCVNILISSQSYQPLVFSSSHFSHRAFSGSGALQKIAVSLGHLNLTSGRYKIDISITDARNIMVLAKGTNLCQFEVTSHYVGYAPIQIAGSWHEEEI